MKILGGFTVATVYGTALHEEDLKGFTATLLQKYIKVEWFVDFITVLKCK